MQNSFVSDSLRLFLTAACLMLMSGCAGTTVPAVKSPAYSSIASQQAVHSGSSAMADFRRVHLVAAKEGRTADYSRARAQLAGALAALRPSRLAPGPPEYEPHALCFETALAAMDRIISAQGKGDREGAAIGWEMLDQSAKSLLLVLDRQTTSSGQEARR